MSRLLDSEDVLEAICNALMCYSDCGITEGREIAEDVVDGIRTACEQVTGKSDLIYRQDAIEALGEEPLVWLDLPSEIAERNQWRSDVNAIEAVPSAQPENARERTDAFALPEIIVLNEYDTIESEDGRTGFGVYVPEEKKIYVAGDVPQEMKLKALFHELAHWVQDVSGIDFDEYTANELSEIIYDAVAPEETHDKRTETHACDCISRQAAIDAVRKCNVKEVTPAYMLIDKAEVMTELMMLPSAPLYTPDEIQTMQDLEWAQMEKMYEIGKAERKKGKWVEIEHTFFHKCSECSWLNDVDSGYAFCPRCGSYNGGEQE